MYQYEAELAVATVETARNNSANNDPSRDDVLAPPSLETPEDETTYPAVAPKNKAIAAAERLSLPS